MFPMTPAQSWSLIALLVMLVVCIAWLYYELAIRPMADYETLSTEDRDPTDQPDIVNDVNRPYDWAVDGPWYDAASQRTAA